MTRIVLLAGPSGSGKSRLTRLVGGTALPLDDFYRDDDHPELPRAHGIVDWDHPDTWDCRAAIAALDELARTGTATVPVYSIAHNRRIGTHHVHVGASGLVIAEGIFAVELLEPARRAGLEIEPIFLDRDRTVVAGLRLHRDLQTRRKRPSVLLRRGYALWRAQPHLRRRALEAGFRPMSMREAVAHLGG